MNIRDDDRVSAVSLVADSSADTEARVQGADRTLRRQRCGSDGGVDGDSPLGASTAWQNPDLDVSAWTARRSRCLDRRTRSSTFPY